MNEQIEREYREALDELRFSDEAKNRMVEALTTGQAARPVKGKHLRPLRTGLIAAALCALLMGTAFAATTVYRLTVQTFDDREHHGEHYAGFDVSGEAAIYFLEDFSQQFQDDYAAWKKNQGSELPGREFDSWEEAKAYLGDGILCTWRDTSDTIWESKYRVQAVPDMSRKTDKLHFVQLYNNVRLNDWRICETVVYLYGEENPYDFLYSMAGFQGTDFQVLEDYPMANGCTAQIVAEVKSTDGDCSLSYCWGFFLKSGLLYQVSITNREQEQASLPDMEAQLHQVLDTFY